MTAPETVPAKQSSVLKPGSNKRLQQLRQFNCRDCPFQGSSAKDLFQHFQQTFHKTDDLSVQCFNCDIIAKNWRDLMVHRRASHYNDLQMCKFITSGETCRYGEDKCFFRHTRMTNVPGTNNNKVVANNDLDFPTLLPEAPPDQHMVTLAEMMKQMKLQTELMQQMQSQMFQFVQIQSTRTPGV